MRTRIFYLNTGQRLVAIFMIVGALGCSVTTPTQVNPPSASITSAPLSHAGGQATIAFKPTPNPTPAYTARAQPWLEGPYSIGLSAGGRPIEIFRFGRGRSARLIVAGMHGGYEWNTTALAEALIEHLSEHPDLVPDNITLYILPVLNPDGAARGQDIDGRANDRDVDLNRNWPALWEPTGSSGACWHFPGLTAGAHPGSEPEARALLAFILENDIELIINYHSAALGIFPGGQPPDPESVRLAEAVSAVSPYPYPPIDLGCHYTGQLIDWASQQSIPALDIELSDHTHIDWEINLEILNVFLAFE